MATLVKTNRVARLPRMRPVVDVNRGSCSPGYLWGRAPRSRGFSSRTEMRKDLSVDAGPYYTPQYNYIEGAEDLESYTSGGLHPVQIGDWLHDRYEVVHKLGFGTFSTTWLARDTRGKGFVAVKLMRADSSLSEISTLRTLNKIISEGDQTHNLNGRPGQNRLILPLLDQFEHAGPNGKHPCYVTEAAACSLSLSKRGYVGGLFHLDVARALAVQAVLAVSFMHANGYVHGGNFLLRLTDQNHKLSNEELYQTYGSPLYEQVTRFDGNPLPAGVPPHICSVVFWDTPCKDLTLANARILLADFGASFSPIHESRFHSYSPVSLRPPEDRFEPDRPVSFSADIWTLGCVLWELLGWRSPFATFFPDEDEVTFEQVVSLGRLPDAWWVAWERRHEYFNENGQPKEGLSMETLTLDQRFDASVQENRRKRGLSMVENDEKDAFLALIRSMLAYQPEERPSVRQVLQSEWMQQWAIPEYDRLIKLSA